MCLKRLGCLLWTLCGRARAVYCVLRQSAVGPASPRESLLPVVELQLVPWSRKKRSAVVAGGSLAFVTSRAAAVTRLNWTGTVRVSAPRRASPRLARWDAELVPCRSAPLRRGRHLLTAHRRDIYWIFSNFNCGRGSCRWREGERGTRIKGVGGEHPPLEWEEGSRQRGGSERV